MPNDPATYDQWERMSWEERFWHCWAALIDMEARLEVEMGKQVVLQMVSTREPRETYYRRKRTESLQKLKEQQ